MGEIVQAPSQGEQPRGTVQPASGGSPGPGALPAAPGAVWLGQTLGDDDAGLRVVGGWVTAGALAIAAGPFLDLIIRLGWWMVGKVVGETGLLAMEFVKSTTATRAQCWACPT